MRRIVKGREPPSLEAHRNDTCVFPNWDNFRGKQQSREHALVEQRAVCAFCQVKLVAAEKQMKLAHVVPRKGTTRGEALQLTWTNIVGGCLGGEDAKRPKLLHCDSQQGQTLLVPQLDPVQFVNGSLYYNSDGEIHSLDPAVEHQLEHVLGLNRKPVLRKRLDALDGEDGIRNLLQNSPAPEQKRQELIALLDPDNPSDQPLLEYADFLLWHLRYGELSHSH
jgi:uncharacterized protein (TIGR02646 family)